MKNIITVLLVAMTLLVSSLASARFGSLGRNDQRVGPQGKEKRVLWEPHIIVFNDTKSILVVYSGKTLNKSGTFMTFYPGDKKQYYYGLLTFGYQNMVIRDSAGQVFFNAKVADENFVHVTSIEVGKSVTYTVSVSEIPE
jgi:hypothetical protein